MRWGPLALFCFRRPVICHVCLFVRYWFYKVLGVSSVIKRRRIPRAARLLVRIIQKL
jgi:hypothetical protein